MAGKPPSIALPELSEAGEPISSRCGWFGLLAAVALLVRLAIAPWTMHGVDMGTFIAWGTRLANVGPATFWKGDYWCDYLPGYLYVLWAMGELSANLSAPLRVLVFKTPNLLADVVTAYLIWRMARPTTSDRKLWMPASYLFNPAILANSTFWGQVDSFHALGLIGGLFLLTHRKPMVAAIAFAIAAAVKPHTIVILPLVGLYVLLTRVAWWRIGLCVLIFVLVWVATFVPFHTGPLTDLPAFIKARVDTTMGEYGFASVNAMNLWYLLGKNWVDDSHLLIGPLTTHQVATGLTLAAIALVLVWFARRFWKQGDIALWESAALTFLVTFLFASRAHERHVFPFFAAILVVAGFRRASVIPYILVSITYCINLALSWAYILPGRQSAQLGSAGFDALVCLATLSALPLAIVSFIPLGSRLWRRVTRLRLLPSPQWTTDHPRWILAGIILFALTIRVARLNAPPERYFDEVYHAYTAQQWAEGNTDAWLCSTSAPDKSCSYEWTHPPLAKLLMQWSIQIFGAHPWAWRLPAALLGTVCILLIYGIARALFARQEIALLAAALASLDTLPLMLSRIGMNDVYCTAFILLAVWAALRRRVVLAPLAVGAALACKWTALYAFPLLGLIHLLRVGRPERWQPRRLATLIVLYAVIVPGMYVGSYMPFFRAGFTVGQFTELQRQMWIYHTSLTKTHPFSSHAWEWPADSGTVWCYTHRSDDETVKGTKTTNSQKGVADMNANTTVPQATVANVYATGNPLIWLPGLAATLFAIFYIIAVRRDTNIIIALVAYLVFWVPWIFSPRIMFIYHYLPSLPYLYILLAWMVSMMGLPRKGVLAYLAIVALAMATLYPYIAAVPMPEFLLLRY